MAQVSKDTKIGELLKIQKSENFSIFSRDLHRS